MKKTLTFALIAAFPLQGALAQEDLLDAAAAAFLYEQARHEEEVAGDPEKAILLYERLIQAAQEDRIPPDHLEDSYLRLRGLLEEMGREDEAEKLHHKLLELFPDSRHLRGLHARKQGSLSKAELFRRVNLLGIWAMGPEDYLEFLPDQRYQRLKHPLDSVEKDAPSEPIASGVYAIDKNRLTLQPAGKAAETFTWEVGVDTLTLKSNTVRTVKRARRPYRFPRNVADREKLGALLNLKASEAVATAGYLEDGGDPDGAAELLASSGPVNEALLEMARGTTSELLVSCGLEILALAERQLQDGNGEGAGASLQAFDRLHWSEDSGSDKLSAALRTYELKANGLAGKWHGFWEEIGETEVRFRKGGPSSLGNGRAHGRWELPVLSEDSGIEDPVYRLEGNRIIFFDGKDSFSDSMAAHCVLRDNRLAFYDDRSGWSVARLERTEALDVQGLWGYFLGQANVLEALLYLTEHEPIRARLRDYYYHMASVSEGTTAGLIARTALRQLGQLDAAHQSGDVERGHAVTRAVQGTQKLLLQNSIPRLLPEIGLLGGSVPSVFPEPFEGVYDSSITLQPTIGKAQRTRPLQLQINWLRQRILEDDLLMNAIDSAPSLIADRFLAEFGESSAQERRALLERHLKIEAGEGGAEVKIAAFPHTDAEVACVLGNQLGEAIAALAPKEEKWSWKLAQRADPGVLPSRLLLPPADHEAIPPRPEDAEIRGGHPQAIHSHFVYRTFVEPFTDGTSIRMDGTFLLLDHEGEVVALRLDLPGWTQLNNPPDSLPFTLVSWDEEGTKREEALKALRGRGPGGHTYRLEGNDLPILCADRVYPDESDGLVISVAPTLWMEPEDIRVDDPSLRWYQFAALKKRRSEEVGQSPKRRLLRLLTLLALTVLLPSIALVWISQRAMSSEREVLEQRFRAFCQDQLSLAVDRWEARWRSAEQGWAAAETYQELLEEPLFVSAVLLDPVTGARRFPLGAESRSPTVTRSHTQWPHARWLEFQDHGYEAAATLYEAIARQTNRIPERREAWQSQVRCLVKGSREEEAMALWQKTSAAEDHEALWETALYLVRACHTVDTGKLAERLVDWLGDEARSAAALPLPKRLFMMKALAVEGYISPSKAAEELLSTLGEKGAVVPDNTLTLKPVGDGLWKMLASDRKSLVFVEESAVATLVKGQDSEALPLSLHHPGTAVEAYMAQRMTGPLSGWSVAMNVGAERNPFVQANHESHRLILWVVWLALAAAALVATGLCRAILREARLNRLKNDFLAAVSHELKTPVTAIGLLVDNLLHKERSEPEETRDYLGLISKENERLGRLIDNFLSFSRMERDKQAFTRQPLSLNEILHEAADVVRERYPDCAARISEDLPREALYLEGDREALTTMMVNLIDNAIKYSQKQVQLDLVPDGGEACIRVRDSGIGMSPEVQGQVFDKFYRADQSLTSETPGVGLGLSIVDFIVRAHRGKVTVESQPGKGSQFTVTLPLQYENATV